MNELKWFAPKTYPFALVLMALLLMWFMGKDSESAKDFRLPALIQDSFRCSAGAMAPTEKLSLYINAEPVARELAQMLCQQAVVKRQYRQVVAYWGGGDVSAISFVGKGLGDLVNTKENLVKAFDAENTYGYKALASYAQYQAYLISLKEKPVISREYLLGRRIGLLDYPSSRSGHIIPLHMLQQLGLNDGQVTLVYSHSHAGLRELLAKGEVDLIASYWSDEDAQHLSANYIQAIGDADISGSTWYLKMENRNTDLFCAVQTALGQLALQQAQGSSYLGHLIFREGCPQPISTSLGGA